MKTFVIGDIHGAHKALIQCLERSNFDYTQDTLISLGDVADGWPETFECFEELLKIKHLIYVRGNHDQWLKDWLHRGKQPDIWTMQGGQNTLKSYLKEDPRKWKKHLDFLSKTPFYYVDPKNRCFVHGGVSQVHTPIEECDKMFLAWDRELWDNRHHLQPIPEFKEVFVGHTSIYRFSHFPANYANVWFLDTGGGWEGKLTIMDINSHEFWQSERVQDLYHNVKGRN